jgi:hypothetical protein
MGLDHAPPPADAHRPEASRKFHHGYPERVAEAMVELAIHSRRSERIGAAHALTAPYWMAPDWTGKLMAGLGVIALARSHSRRIA